MGYLKPDTEQMIRETGLFGDAPVRTGSHGDVIVTLYDSGYSGVTATVTRHGGVEVMVHDWRGLWHPTLLTRHTTLSATGRRTRDPRTWFILAGGLVRLNRSVQQCVDAAFEVATKNDSEWMAADSDAADTFRRAASRLLDGQRTGRALMELHEDLSGSPAPAPVDVMVASQG